ncbi:hypothetical protein CBL_05274 [Carabus blaptoides fortunei]
MRGPQLSWGDEEDPMMYIHRIVASRIYQCNIPARSFRRHHAIPYFKLQIQQPKRHNNLSASERLHLQNAEEYLPKLYKQINGKPPLDLALCACVPWRRIRLGVNVGTLVCTPTPRVQGVS